MISEVFNIDCNEYMNTIPDGFFDLAIVDPPYFDGPNKSGYYGNGYSSLGVKRAKHYGETKQWNIPDESYFEQLFRVSKNQIVWGANHFAGVFDSSSSCWIVWDKVNGASSFADAELAYTSFPGAVRIFKYMWNGMHQGSFGGDVSKNEKRIHPTQKPVVLYEWLLTKFAQKGQRMLDTHMGSQSSRIAADKFGIDYYGTETDKAHFAAGNKRFEEFKLQLKLF